MLINVIFSPEKLLGLAHCRVQFDPPVEVSDSDAVIRKAAIQKPGPDSLDGVMTRGKFFSYLCRSPVVSGYPAILLQYNSVVTVSLYLQNLL